jgi:MFS transporter, ACS family, tartrate transporter
MIEGNVPVVLGFVVLMLLPDKPIQARWLSDGERDVLERELGREHAEQHPHHHVADFTNALRGVRLWHLGLLYFMLIMGLYGFIYWAPTIIKSVASGKTDLQIGMLSAVPYLVAAVTMMLIGRHADRRNERRWHVAICAIIAAAGVTLLSRCHSLPAVMAAMCFATIGIFGSLGPFWALATRYLRGTAAAGGIAIVNSIGALAGFVAPSVIGWVKGTTGSFAGGLLAVAAALACGALLVLSVPTGIDRSR